MAPAEDRRKSGPNLAAMKDTVYMNLEVVEWAGRIYKMYESPELIELMVSERQAELKQAMEGGELFIERVLRRLAAMIRARSAKVQPAAEEDRLAA